jgi:putative transcriptional regulator
MTSFAGMLLVAPPALTDPNFVETVVVVLLHNESGAFGLVLNRATDVSPIDAVPAWADVTGPTVRHGGPVETDALIAIGRIVGPIEPSGYRAIETPTLGSIGLVDLHGHPTDSLRDVTLFAGYTGWGPGQLDGEVLMGGWVVVSAQAGDPFDTGLDSLWGRVLRRADRTDPTLRLLPDDLALN